MGLAQNSSPTARMTSGLSARRMEIRFTTGCGTVFKITLGGTLTTPLRFDGSDGAYPYAGLVQASDGNFYGNTLEGGNLNCNSPYGCGTVFKMTPSGTRSTLHTFDGSGGESPFGSLVQASDGNLYGTTDRSRLCWHGLPRGPGSHLHNLPSVT